MRGSKYHNKRATIGPQAKRRFRRRVDGGPALNTGLVAWIFQGIRASITKKTNIFSDFSGSPDPLSSPLDPHMSI